MKLAGLQADIAKFQRMLDDPDLYKRNPPKFQKTTQELTAAELALAAAEGQWLTLELLREELDA